MSSSCRKHEPWDCWKADYVGPIPRLPPGVFRGSATSRMPHPATYSRFEETPGASPGITTGRSPGFRRGFPVAQPHGTPHHASRERERADKQHAPHREYTGTPSRKRAQLLTTNLRLRRQGSRKTGQEGSFAVTSVSPPRTPDCMDAKLHRVAGLIGRWHQPPFAGYIAGARKWLAVLRIERHDP